MITRLASAVAVGALLAGALPGLASAATTPTVETTTTSTLEPSARPIGVMLTGGDTARDVLVRFDLTGPSRLTPDDIALNDLVGPASPAALTVTGDTGAVAAETAAVTVAAGTAVPLSFDIAVNDAYVDGPIELTTTVLDAATRAPLATDTDTLTASGSVNLGVAVSEIPNSELGGAPVEFTARLTNDGAPFASQAVVHLNLQAYDPDAVAPTLEYLDGDTWTAVTLTGDGQSQSAELRSPGFTIGRDYDETLRFRLSSTGTATYGGLLTVGIGEVGGVGTYVSAESGYQVTEPAPKPAVTLTGLAKLEAGKPASGNLEITNTGGSFDPESVHLVFKGAGVSADSLKVTSKNSLGRVIDAEVEEHPAGTVVASIPSWRADWATVPAGGELDVPVTVHVLDNSLDGDVALTVDVMGWDPSTGAVDIAATTSATTHLTATTTLAAPSAVTAATAGNSKATVSWKPVVGAENYRVSVLNEAGRTIRNSENWYAPGSDTSIELSGLPSGKAVKFAVRAFSGTSSSRPATVDFTVPQPTFAAPGNLELKRVEAEDGTVDLLTWTGAEDTYRVEIGDAVGEGLMGGTAYGNSFRLDLSPSTTYTATVWATDTWDDNGPVATATITTGIDRPEADLTLRGGKQHVTWAPVAGAAHTVTVNGRPVTVTGDELIADPYLSVGENVVRITAKTADDTASSTIYVYRSALAVSRSATVQYGSRATVSGVVDGATWRAVVLQRYDAAKKVWRDVAATEAGPETGWYGFTVPSAATATYRTYIAPERGASGAVSASTVVTVVPRVTLKASASKIKAGGVVTLTATSTGAAAGTPVTFQQLVGRTWKSVGSVKLVGAGGAALKLKLRTKGAFSYRAVVSGTATTGAATTGYVKVTVA